MTATEVGVFAAGCFWGVQEAFEALDGVTATEVGYTGGDTAQPTYEDVCGKSTGHAESVRVEFDPARVSYEELLAVFFASHDPTQVNRQGPDIGDQYRSAIFPQNPAQEAAARAAIQREGAGGKHGAPIATTIEPANDWWRAEEYHQHFFAKRGR